MPDWGWGIAFHMVWWWLLVMIGVLVVAGWLFIGLSKRADRDESDA